MHILLAKMAGRLSSATRRSGRDRVSRPLGACFAPPVQFLCLRRFLVWPPAALENHTFGLVIIVSARPAFPPNPQYRRRPSPYARTRPHAGYTVLRQIYQYHLRMQDQDYPLGVSNSFNHNVTCCLRATSVNQCHYPR